LVELWLLVIDDMGTCALLPLGNVVGPPREETSDVLARRVEDEADTSPHVDPNGRRMFSERALASPARGAGYAATGSQKLCEFVLVFDI
jgi:hypothetical protein